MSPFFMDFQRTVTTTIAVAKKFFTNKKLLVSIHTKIVRTGTKSLDNYSTWCHPILRIAQRPFSLIDSDALRPISIIPWLRGKPDLH